MPSPAPPRKWNFHGRIPTGTLAAVSVQHYQVHDGLFAGEYPGSFAPEITEQRLKLLLEKGVTTFIDLTTPHDHLAPYEPMLKSLGDGLERHSHGIPDMDVPEAPETMRSILDLIRAERSAGRTCYVHCWGGIGRTGTVIGCWLKESGADAWTALAQVQRLYAAGMPKVTRHPRSPQTSAQVRYVRDWS